MLFNQHICPVSLFGLFVVNHGVIKPLHMGARLPHFGMHEDSSIHTHNIVVMAGHGIPPLLAGVSFLLRSPGSVIVNGSQASINFWRLKDKPSGLPDGDKFFYT